MKREYFQDLSIGILVFLTIIGVFGYRSDQLGIYADDPGFLLTVYPGMTLNQLSDVIGSYVTGRNLHILWQYLITLLVGGSSVTEVPSMHHVHVAVDALNGLGLFFALRLWGVHVAGAFLAAMAFAFFPNHGETHFWLSALPMNVLSATFVLALMCLVPMLVRSINEKRFKTAILKTLLILIFFCCAMLTYDQVVPVTMSIINLLAIGFLYKFRKLRVPTVILWLFCNALFVGLLIWKVGTPAGGPVFRNINLSHIYEIFLQSIKVWGRLGAELAFDFVRIYKTLVTAKVPYLVDDVLSNGELAIAILTTGAIVFATHTLLPSNNSRGLPNTWSWAEYGVCLKRGTILLVTGAFFFILAYLPAYLWYLSPRHSYFPSIGVAIILASLATMLIPALKRSLPIKVIVLSLVGFVFLSFTLRNLIEKNDWISSYEMRKNMYQKIAERYASENPTSILFAGFPSSPRIGGTPLAFLTGEHAGAPSIITNGVIKATRIALHPIPSMSGYFVQTEEGRWGENAFIHIEKASATILIYEGIRDSRLMVDYDKDHSRFNHEKFYSLKMKENAYQEEKNELIVSYGTAGFNIQIPSVNLSDGETLALVACSFSAGKLSPVFHNTSIDSERFLIPVDVSGTRDSRRASANLQYKIPMPTIEGFQLYVVDHERARLIYEAKLK